MNRPQNRSERQAQADAYYNGPRGDPMTTNRIEHDRLAAASREVAAQYIAKASQLLSNGGPADLAQAEYLLERALRIMRLAREDLS
jgi:hypothetical protein